jgi:hypothetical protein
MPSIRASLLVVLALLVPRFAAGQGQLSDGKPTSANPGSAPAAEYRAHRGLSVNVSLGLGELFTSFDYGDSSGPRYAFGGTFPVGLELGIAATAQLVVFGEVYDAHVIGSIANDRSIGPFDLYGIGPGAKYYFNPSNTFLSGSLLLSQFHPWPESSDFGSTPEPSHWGMTARLSLGKEWWLGSHVAVGLSGEITLGQMPGRPRSSNDPSFDYTTKGFSLVFSGSYNYPSGEVPPSIPGAAASDSTDGPSPHSRGYHTHDGLYADAHLGVGWLRGVPGAGGSYARGVSIGYALSNGLVVLGEYYDATIYGPSSDPSVAALDFQGFGPGAKYYLMPFNVFLSGSVLIVCQLTERNNGDWRTGNASWQSEDESIAGRFSVGKEWWVSANWGLGVAGEFVLGRVEGHTVNAYALLLSASFN